MSDEHPFAFLLALRQIEKLMAKKKHQRKHIFVTYVYIIVDSFKIVK